MQVKVDEDKCIGCGACVAVAPKTFKLNDMGKCEVILPVGDKLETVKEAVESCPVEAITVED